MKLPYWRRNTGAEQELHHLELHLFGIFPNLSSFIFMRDLLVLHFRISRHNHAVSDFQINRKKILGCRANDLQFFSPKISFWNDDRKGNSRPEAK